MGIELGKTYRDSVTGFTGTATGRAVYLHDLPKVLLTADTGANGDLTERWVSEARLALHEEREISFSVDELQ